MPRVFWGALLSCGLLLAAVAAVAEGGAVEIMDKVVCSVANSIITFEELEVEHAILLKAHDSILYPGQEGMTRDQALEEIVARRLLYLAASRMGLSTVDDKALEEAMTAFRGRFAPGEYANFLKHFELKDSLLPSAEKADASATDLVYRFRSVLVVAEFAEKKLGIQVKLAMKEALEKLKEADEADPAAKPDEEAAQKIESDIRQAKLREWLRDLASREAIVICDPAYRTGIRRLQGLEP